MQRFGMRLFDAKSDGGGDPQQTETKKEDMPEWAKQMQETMNNLTGMLSGQKQQEKEETKPLPKVKEETPAKETTVEIPAPPKPKKEQPQEQQSAKKKSLWDYLF
ncbi:hypothetical protein PMI08_03162 [Brevibacillus sp. CF112]|nr:hypothetical protein PMI08_03162 [Brevibacillus sp. CF112]